ncbi:hypothetical protein GCM10009808_18880 [Microbacterium sediminicola]|uniref:Lipoprotein n=1 Tax=Microbacterium sediminicola TaxID=415210 RepID=A0ABN2IAA1_9MICO
MGRRVRRGGAVAALLAVVLVGCAAPSPTGITASIEQQRSDVALRQAQILVVNDGDTEIEVAEVVVEDPRFDGEAARVVDRTSRIAPGAAVGIRVQLPEMACDVGDVADTTVTVDYEVGGVAHTATLAAPDTLGFLPGLHERECRARRVAEAVSLAFTDFLPAAPGEASTLVLEVRPTGAADATIDAIRSTNLLLVGDDVDADRVVLPLDIRVTSASDAAPTLVELPILPFRCDAHAVQEDKRGTIFPFEVTVDGQSGTIELPVPDEMKGRILTWVAQWCGFA